MKIKINAILTTKSPMHISAPESGRYDPLTRYLNEYGTDGYPCTMTQKTCIATEGNTSKDGLENIATIEKAPVIAANNIAGRLRRHAARIFLDALHATNQKVTMNTYNALMCGAISSAPDSEDTTYAQFLKASLHPYLGLFGGGPRMYKRHVRIHNALPINMESNALAGKLVHPHAKDYEQNGFRKLNAKNGEEKLTQVIMSRRNDDVHTLENLALQERSIKDFSNEIVSRQAIIMDQKAKGKDSDAKTSTFSFSALEIVVPNVNFSSVFELDVQNDAQVGLFLLSLNSFANSERIGGLSRNGFGMFEFNDVILTDDQEVQHDGIFNNGELNTNNTEVLKYISAWEKTAADVKAEDIEAMYALSPAAIARAKKKIKEKAKAREIAKAIKEKADAKAA